MLHLHCMYGVEEHLLSEVYAHHSAWTAFILQVVFNRKYFYYMIRKHIAGC